MSEKTKWQMWLEKKEETKLEESAGGCQCSCSGCSGGDCAACSCNDCDCQGCTCR